MTAVIAPLIARRWIMNRYKQLSIAPPIVAIGRIASGVVKMTAFQLGWLPRKRRVIVGGEKLGHIVVQRDGA